MAETKDWASLLTQPMSVLGPYKGKAPSLSSFAPHSLRFDHDLLALAGQFMELPEGAPSTWGSGSNVRAYAVFEFHEIKNCTISGSPKAARDDDSMHGQPVGEVGACSLANTNEVFLTIAESNRRLYWKSFTFESKHLQISLLASSVSLYVGRQAGRQYGWPQHA
jgi:hypothetical protein